MATAQDGLPRLEAFVSARPGRAEIAQYRREVAALSSGDVSFHRALLVAAIDAYSAGTDSDRTRMGFARSAALHTDFLAGDDAALTEIARAERIALDAWLHTGAAG
jgi:hypothetical protein